jgi:hypothetical protein
MTIALTAVPALVCLVGMGVAMRLMMRYGDKGTRLAAQRHERFHLYEADEERESGTDGTA